MSTDGTWIGGAIVTPETEPGDFHPVVASLTATLPENQAGDFNGDGAVDGADLAAWRQGFGMNSGAQAANGDADGDADVDGADFLVWQQQLGNGAAVSAVVPEPGSASMLIVSIAAASVFRRLRGVG
jgi:hypothetical protein